MDIAKITREMWPEDKPVFVRLSVSDHHEAGEKDSSGAYISWGEEQSIVLVKELVALGIDLVDATSGGLDPVQKSVRTPSRMSLC